MTITIKRSLHSSPTTIPDLSVAPRRFRSLAKKRSPPITNLFPALQGPKPRRTTQCLPEPRLIATCHHRENSCRRLTFAAPSTTAAALPSDPARRSEALRLSCQSPEARRSHLRPLLHPSATTRRTGSRESSVSTTNTRRRRLSTRSSTRPLR